MQFYHGSREKNLKFLSMQKANHNKIYLTDNYFLALLYAASSIRNWRMQNDKVVFRETAENGFKILYKNQPCFIYKTEDIYDAEKTEHSSNSVYTVEHDVKLTKCEFIPDVYQKILQEAKAKNIIIERYADYNEQEKESIKKNILQTFTPEIMKAEKERFHDEYKLLLKLYPYLKQNCQITK